MIISIRNSCTDPSSYRAARIKSMFNVEERGNGFSLDADLPADDPSWRIGVIVGPSGSGKSSLGRCFWPDTSIADLSADWPADRPVIDAIAPGISVDVVTSSLASVGLGDVPAWLRPYHVLSVGEKFRAGLARIIAEPPARVIVDEFTSALDRNVARTGALAFAKAWRRTSGQCLLLTCHRDILAWIQPDWYYNTAEGVLHSGRCLRRPRLHIDICKTGWRYWPLFEPHHYLKLPNMIAAITYVGFIDDTPVCHAGVTTHCKGKGEIEARIARIVVMPEYQGIGIGHRFINQIAEWCLQGSPEARLPGRPMTTLINTSHPGFARTLRHDLRWRQITATLTASKSKTPKSSYNIKSKYGGHFRAILGFRYVGDAGLAQ